MKESEWSLGMQLSRSYYAFKRAAAKRMEAFGLTPEQFSVLSELAKQDGVSQKQLALVTERDQTTIGKILDKLGKKELIVRTPDPRDRRAVLLLMTREGRDIVDRLEPELDQLQLEAFRGLSREQIELLKETLETIHRNVT